jgi:hypothetical protein
VSQTFDALEDLFEAVTEFLEEIQPPEWEFFSPTRSGGFAGLEQIMETTTITQSIIYGNISWCAFLSADTTTY